MRADSRAKYNEAMGQLRAALAELKAIKTASDPLEKAYDALIDMEEREDGGQQTTTDLFMSRAGFTQPKPQWFYRSDNKGGDYRARRMSDGYFNVQYWPLDAKEFVYEMTFPSNCDFETWAKCELV